MCNSVQQAAQQLTFGLPGQIQSCLRKVARAEAKARALTPAEYAVFSANFNSGQLLVAYSDETQVMSDLERIRFCDFEGKNVLFQLELFPEAVFSLAHTTFQDCRIESGSRVCRTSRVRRTVLLAYCNVEGCGLVSGPKTIATNFGNGLRVSPGLGTGERAVSVVLESTLEHVARVSLDQFQCPPSHGEEYSARVAEYISQCSSEFTIICELARVEQCPELLCCFVGRKCVVSSGSTLRHSTLMELCVVEQNSTVDTCLLQPRVKLASQAIAVNSLLCQQSQVDCQGKLLDSVLGPRAHLAEGEINASLIGPLVGFHHQAMLIATFWPRGRGNVGYGANCGSNHTSRCADQSLWPGEGVFFGLGCCIKLPLNLTLAAYSIVATGVTFGPGKLVFPFSLVTSGNGTECQVAPGWGIESNAYSLERNEMKMASRAPDGYDSKVFSQFVAKQVYVARLVLIRALGASDKQVFKHEAGMELGGGFALRKDFEKGVRGYTRFLQLYSLRNAVGRFRVVQVPDQVASAEIDQTWEVDYAQTGMSLDSEEDERETVEWFLRRVFAPEQVGKPCVESYPRADMRKPLDWTRIW
ncbi:hypothetical protein BASA81_008692 [Batrachochytrium salamandrivorans]|nr:hypothetical protein BASA81_008692 [Batrachochytrium salamandrivorans]